MKIIKNPLSPLFYRRFEKNSKKSIVTEKRHKMNFVTLLHQTVTKCHCIFTHEIQKAVKVTNVVDKTEFTQTTEDIYS